MRLGIIMKIFPGVRHKTHGAGCRVLGAGRFNRLHDRKIARPKDRKTARPHDKVLPDEELVDMQL